MASGLKCGDEIWKYLIISGSASVFPEEYQPLKAEKIIELFVKAKKQKSTILLFIRRDRNDQH